MGIDASAEIHPTAVVSDGATVGADCRVGPYCVVGPEVVLGRAVVLHSHVAVAGATRIGDESVVFPFASLGHRPQDLKFRGEPVELVIGARNTIREHVTMNPGTAGGGSLTRVGDGCLFMVNVHVAHDCIIGDDVIMANNATLAGHVEIADQAFLGGLSAVHQFVRIGRGAMIGGLAGVVADVIPFGTVTGERAHLSGLNLVGLKRRNATRGDIHGLRAAFSEMFEGGGTLQDRARATGERHAGNALVEEVVGFITAEFGAVLHPAGLSGVKDGLGIVAGRGALPRLVAEECVRSARPYRVVVFEGVALDWLEGQPVIHAAFERPGRLFAALRAAGCGAVTFAGGIVRPKLRPTRFDLTMLRIAPRLLGAVRAGDDATLRKVASVFEAAGFRVEAPQALLPHLPVPAGMLSRALPSDRDRADAARAAAIVAAMGAVDVGQAAVVAQGICLGVEFIQGTDALLDFVARTAERFRPDPRGPKGVLYKGPKPGQDLRLDLPAIGPDTLHGAARAGLAGVAVEAGGVMILDTAAAVAAADKAGLFLWAREP